MAAPGNSVRGLSVCRLVGDYGALLERGGKCYRNTEGSSFTLEPGIGGYVRGEPPNTSPVRMKREKPCRCRFWVSRFFLCTAQVVILKVAGQVGRVQGTVTSAA